MPVAVFPFSPVWPKSDSPKPFPPRIYNLVIALSISADMPTVEGNGDVSWMRGGGVSTGIDGERSTGFPSMASV